MPEPANEPSKPTPRRERMSWYVAPLLATLAIAFQYSFDVPQGQMLQRETKEEKAAKARAKKQAKAKKKAQERAAKAKEKRGKARAKRPKPWEPRSAEEVDELRRTYSTAPFDDEPRDASFRRHHEALLRSATTKVRADVTGDGELISMQIRPACRTLRCELELCGPEELLGKIATRLPDLRVNEDEPLWHEFREVDPRSTSRKVGARAHKCRRWLVSFANEDISSRTMTLAEPDAK